MEQLRVLFIGGSGQISVDCVKESLRQGHAVWIFNRGNHNDVLPSDHHYSWNAIYRLLGKALGREPVVKHVPIEKLLAYNSDFAGPLKGIWPTDRLRQCKDQAYDFMVEAVLEYEN